MKQTEEDKFILKKSSLREMLNKLKPLDEMGCVGFKLKVDRFIKEIDKPYKDLMIEGKCNGLFVLLRNILKQGVSLNQFLIKRINLSAIWRFLRIMESKIQQYSKK